MGIDDFLAGDDFDQAGTSEFEAFKGVALPTDAGEPDVASCEFVDRKSPKIVPLR